MVSLLVPPFRVCVEELFAYHSLMPLTKHCVVLAPGQGIPDGLLATDFSPQTLLLLQIMAIIFDSSSFAG